MNGNTAPMLHLFRFGCFMAMLSLCAPTFGHDEKKAAWLPLGDGKYSNAPEKGKLFSCITDFPGGGGAHRTGDWLRAGAWNRSLKPIVGGNINWPNAAIAVSVEGESRIVRANGLPRHQTGVFPIDHESKAYQFDHNPNEIAMQDILLTLPANPVIVDKPSCLPMGMIGFALSGVAIFNAFDLSGRDAPAYEIQDKCNGHPERKGQYHYHDWSPCIANERGDSPVGYMLDGFPILPPVDSKGREWKTADLDQCHGMIGPVLIDGSVKQQYHYRFTRDFPYTIACFSGTPIAP
jgi:hypothetical protein